MKLTEVAYAIKDSEWNKSQNINTPEEFLEYMTITKYTIRKDGFVDVHEDVDLAYSGFDHFPVKFGIVTGDFKCNHCLRLVSFEGAPQEIIKGEFRASECPLITNLEHSPTRVDSHFNISRCSGLTSLKGAPKKVGGNFNCAYAHKLTSLEGCPEEVGGNVFLDETALKSLDFLPKKINGRLSLDNIPDLKDYLKIFNTKGISHVIITRRFSKLENILNKYLPTQDMLNCQDELIEAGLERFAEVD